MIRLSRATLHEVSRRQQRGLTLIELMVTLVVSVLVMGMVMPLLTSLLKTPTKGALSAEPLWESTMQADLSALVSPSKCGVPVFQVIPASNTQPYPELLLETFCRASGSDANALSCGPSEIRYCLESDGNALSLVRYAKGWHDPEATRYVLSRQVTGWTLDFDGIPPPQSVTSGTPTAPVRAGRLLIEETSEATLTHAALWVPLFNASTPDTRTDKQSDNEKPGAEGAGPEGVPTP